MVVPRITRSFGLLGALSLAGLALAAASVFAQPRPPAGVLRCDVSGGVSFIFGSTRRLECVFSPSQSRAPEFYSGRINKFGVDVGFITSGVMIWSVLAPGSAWRVGSLEGGYGGVSAEVAAGAGVGANALIGGNQIVLNPISVEGLTGLNVAAGIAGLELNYVRPAIQRPLPVQPRRQPPRG